MDFNELRKLFDLVSTVARDQALNSEIDQKYYDLANQAVENIRKMVLDDIYKDDDLCITKELINSYNDNGFILDINKQIVSIDGEYSIVVVNSEGVGIVITKVSLNDMKRE